MLYLVVWELGTYLFLIMSTHCKRSCSRTVGYIYATCHYRRTAYFLAAISRDGNGARIMIARIYLYILKSNVHVGAFDDNQESNSLSL